MAFTEQQKKKKMKKKKRRRKPGRSVAPATEGSGGHGDAGSHARRQSYQPVKPEGEKDERDREIENREE